MKSTLTSECYKSVSFRRDKERIGRTLLALRCPEPRGHFPAATPSTQAARYAPGWLPHTMSPCSATLQSNHKEKGLRQGRQWRGYRRRRFGAQRRLALLQLFAAYRSHLLLVTASSRIAFDKLWLPIRSASSGRSRRHKFEYSVYHRYTSAHASGWPSLKRTRSRPATPRARRLRDLHCGNLYVRSPSHHARNQLADHSSLPDPLCLVTILFFLWVWLPTHRTS